MNNGYKLSLSSLSIECTRRCNMKCAHCMRGPAQAKDLNPEAVYRMFEHIDYIGSITPTGGEPSLNPDALNTIADAIRKYSVTVSGIYIVTNGKQVSDDFISGLMNAMLATEMDEYSSGIALSVDMFHDHISAENIKKLRLFAGFDMESKKTDWTKIPPIARGRASSLTSVIARHRDYGNAFYDAEIDENDRKINIPDGQLALTVDGNIVSDCDYAYRDVRRLTICNVFDDNWVDTFLAKTRKAIRKQSA